jgi:hypothetical protein
VVSLRNSIGGEADFTSRLEEFRRRADALAQRSVQYFTTGWERLLIDHGDKTDLIEAKLHLAYAEIDPVHCSASRRGRTRIAAGATLP